MLRKNALHRTKQKLNCALWIEVCTCINHMKRNLGLFVSCVCLRGEENTQTIPNNHHQQDQQCAVPCCSISPLQQWPAAHTTYCSCISQRRQWQFWQRLHMSLAEASVWSAVLSGGNSFLFNRFVKNESITAFLWEDSHFRWVEGHLSSKVWRHRLADPARNQKPNPFKVLALSFVCISLSIRVRVRHSFQVTYGPKAICHELSPFFISIWICPDDLHVSSVRVQLQQQLLSSNLILQAAHPLLRSCSLTFSEIYLIFIWDHISEWPII